MIFDNVCSFLVYFSALHISLVGVQDFSLIVTTHNSTALKINGMTEEILFAVLFGQEIFVSGHQTQKSHVYAHNFSAFFCLLTCTNPTTLMDAKQ